MIHYIKSCFKLEAFVQYVVAICSSIIINLSIQILPFVKLKSIDAVVTKWNIGNFTFGLRIIFVAVLLLIILRLINQLLNRLAASRPICKYKPKQRSVFLSSFFLTLFFWSICFLFFFPGAGMNDTINGFISPSSTGNMQPFLYQLYLYTMFSLGQRLFGGIGTLSYALLSIIQMMFCALCVAYSTEWLYEKCMLTQTTALVYCMYFALHPIIADYSLTIIKDTPFSFSLLIVLPIYFDILYQKMSPDKWTLFVIGLFIFWFTRSNGKYVVVLILIMTLIRFKSYVKEIIAILIAMLIINGASTLVITSINPSDVSMRESSGIILNQISAVIAADGDISEDSFNTINKILPYEQWRQKYKVSFVDTLKFAPDFDATYLQDHKTEFINAWRSIVFLNPVTCIKAYTLQTFGLWSIMTDTPVDYTQSLFTKIHNNVGDDSTWAAFCREQNCVNIRLLPDSICSLGEKLYVSCFKSDLKVKPGLYLLVLIILFALGFDDKDEHRIDMQRISYMFSIPFLIHLTNMVACPASFIFRYSFYLVLTIPLLTVLVINGRVFPGKLTA